MKILFLTHYFPPEVNAPASRTYEHCVRWVKAGHEVTVVICAPNCPDGVVFEGYRNRLRRQVEMVDGIRVVRVWTYLAANSGMVRRIANYLSFMLSATMACLRLPRPDVVVATSPQFFCGWAGVLVSWLKWRPLVLEIRDLLPESISAVGAMRKGIVIRFLEWLERRMYRAADHIVAVGRGYADNIAGKVDVGDRISVVMNGVDLQQFQPQECDDKFLTEYGLTGKFVCSYIGTIGMAHGLDVVVEAARLLKGQGRDDVRFCLVGDGARRESIQQLAREKGVEELVVFTGRQPKERMPTILASSGACLIHLRGCELFGTVIPSKIFETMAMGRPIIMGVQGEARDLVEAAGAGLVMQPDSAESLVDCVDQLIEDPELRGRLQTRGRDFVRENYNRDELAAEMLATLQQVAGDETRTGAEQVAADGNRSQSRHDEVLEASQP